VSPSGVDLKKLPFAAERARYPSERTQRIHGVWRLKSTQKSKATAIAAFIPQTRLAVADNGDIVDRDTVFERFGCTARTVALASLAQGMAHLGPGDIPETIIFALSHAEDPTDVLNRYRAAKQASERARILDDFANDHCAIRPDDMMFAFFGETREGRISDELCEQVSRERKEAQVKLLAVEAEVRAIGEAASDELVKGLANDGMAVLLDNGP